jgi:hypothetical protein
MYENSIIQTVLNERGGIRKSNRVGKMNQSVLYACIQTSQ